MTRIKQGLYAHATTDGVVYISRLMGCWVWECSGLSDTINYKSIQAAKDGFTKSRNIIKMHLAWKGRQ